jgi:Peptidase family M23/RTX calcium-binding nonapeptide repeat (4 copies)
MITMPGPRRTLALLLLAGTLVVPDASAGSRTRTTDGPTWVPLKGRVVVGRTWGHAGGHSFPSIDFEVPAGKNVPVYAAGPGTVITAVGNCPDTTAGGAHADCNGGQGNLVEIVHPDGRRSRYLHLAFDGVMVTPGEHVCRGCQIGRSGWSGNVSPAGPGGGHLHYEELRGFRPVDPGPMHALHRGGRVVYPRGGARWKQVGADRIVIRNTGYPPPGPAPIASCQGWAATRIGTAGPDNMLGTPGPDIIAAGAGADSVRGADGDDRICGGLGDDTLVGGANEDIIDGGDGTDTCYVEEEDGYTRGEETVVSCERPPYVLTVSVGCCARFVISEPGGISCPPDCSEPFDPGTVVTLTHSPGPARWSGCDQESVGQTTCVVTMTSDRHIVV